MKLKLILLLAITFTFIIILTSIEVLAAECVIEYQPGNFKWDSTNPSCRCKCTSDAQCIATLTVSAPGLGGYLTSTGNACTGKAMIDIDEQNRYFLTTCDDPSPILNAPYPDGGERLICPNEASSQYSPQVRQPICEPERALPEAPSCGDGLIVNGLEISGCMINENSNYDSQYTEPKCKVCLECSGEVPLEECSDASCSKWDKRNCYYNPLVTIRPYNIDWDLSGERNQIKGKYYCGYTDQLWDYINFGTPVEPNKPLFEVEFPSDIEICDAVNDPESCKNPCPDDDDFYAELDSDDIGIENLEDIIESMMLEYLYNIEAIGGDPGTPGKPFVLGSQRGFGDVLTYEVSFVQEFGKGFILGGGGDFIVGNLPGISTIADFSAALRGKEPISQQSTAIFGSESLGRGVSLIGAVLPGVSGGMIRGTGKVGKFVRKLFGKSPTANIPNPTANIPTSPIGGPCPQRLLRLPSGELLSGAAAEEKFIKEGGNLLQRIYYDKVMGYNTLGIGTPTKFNAAAFFGEEGKLLYGEIPEGFILTKEGYFHPIKGGKALPPLKPFRP